MAKYKCKICGYVYNTENGEDRRDVLPGTEWADVPEDFKCPLCGAPKNMFKEI